MQAGVLAADRSGLELDVRVGLSDPDLSSAVLTGLNKRAEHPVHGLTVTIVPGDAEGSQLWLRMGLRDLEAMPPRGSEVVDKAGMQVVADWINQL